MALVLNPPGPYSSVLPFVLKKVRSRISGYEMFNFWTIWRALFSCHLYFEICLFALLTTIYPAQLGITKKRI